MLVYLIVSLYRYLKNQESYRLGNNTDLVPDLLDGKIKSREKVDNKIRGKGIPQIAVNSNSQYFARAYIISNDVKINLKIRQQKLSNTTFLVLCCFGN